ncbi:serine carboxypeptidase-like 48 [Andrographis paniculata]|uniref:serine carboxypeptidase-like 48 n=1 Tax=Andrographis paniculata TaxID=175694 RepID=UPI0021E909F8|nr:serine carboxypeptidase-like 48 [Andrographis paniculata]
MFYFFFESRGNQTDPVVIWLTGGPGCGSELALFYENGPFHITSNLSLSLNDFGWDKVSNIIFVDQPTGTGFSYSSDDRDIRSDEEGVSNDLYSFLQAFFKEHPQFVKNDFFITGESYAGHYIPALASRIHQANQKNEGIHINMKGFAIGNGLTNPAIQYKAYPDYALNAKLIQQADYDMLQQKVSFCEQATKPCGNQSNAKDSCDKAYNVCGEIFNDILAIAGDINYYDIRKQCEGLMCYDFSNVETFLNQDPVKKALGVGDIEYVSCSTTVYQAMSADWMRNLADGIPSLLDLGIKVLVYAGEYDLICNWLGNWRWVDELVWSGQKQYAAAKNGSFMVDGKDFGLQKGFGPLSFLKVYNAGHLVPMDQPKPSLEMISRWTKGLPL